MRFKKVFSNLELEGQEYGIIMGVTRLLLLGPFYTIQTNFMYFFAHDCSIFEVNSSQLSKWVGKCSLDLFNNRTIWNKRTGVEKYYFFII